MLKSHNYVIQIEMEVIRLEKLETGFQKQCKEKIWRSKDRQQRGQRWEKREKAQWAWGAYVLRGS